MFGVPGRITSETAMVKTPVQLVDGVSDGSLTVHEIGRGGCPDRLFTSVTNVFDPARTGTLLVNLLFLVIEPL